MGAAGRNSATAVARGVSFGHSRFIVAGLRRRRAWRLLGPPFVARRLHLLVCVFTSYYDIIVEQPCEAGRIAGDWQPSVQPP